QAIRIGDLGMAAIPCEVFAETGLEIKQRSALRPTFVIELANGYNGYLPTPEQHAWGGYETWPARSAYLEVEAAPKIRDGVLDLLASVARLRTIPKRQSATSSATRVIACFAKSSFGPLRPP